MREKARKTPLRGESETAQIASFPTRRPFGKRILLIFFSLLLPLFFGFLFFRLTAEDLPLRIELLALLAALLLHEGGHLLAICFFGRRNRRKHGATGKQDDKFTEKERFSGDRVLLRPWGIELQVGRSYRSYGEQIAVSLAGVAANLLTMLLLWWGVKHGRLPGGSLFLDRLRDCSLLFALLNLLPIEGLDGGSALEALLLFLTPIPMHSIRRLLQCLSLLLLIPLWLLSLCVLIASNGNLSFFALCISLFLELYRGKRS